MDATDEIAVIVMFTGNQPGKDRLDFLSRHGGSSFSVRHVFNIISAVSGRVSKEYLHGLHLDPGKVQVHHNAKRTLPVVVPEATRTSSPASDSGAWWRGAIGLDPAVTGELDGAGIKVGVLDTGIGFNTTTGYAVHPDLQDRIRDNINFAAGLPDDDVYDVYGHGTHVAGIIAASGAASNGLYMGLAPATEIYNVKVLNNSGSGFQDDIIAGIEWCVEQELDIINLSLGGGPPDPDDPESLALLNASRQGVLAVVSGGNNGPRLFTLGSPAGASGIITVGSTGPGGNVSSFSSRGPSFNHLFKPDIVAPGEEIISTLGFNSFLEKYLNYFNLVIPGTGSQRSRYISLDGTSMAAPVVAGASALLMERFSNYSLSPAIIIASLMEGATDLDLEPCVQGMGLVNVSAAMLHLQSILDQDDTNVTVHVFPKELPYAPFDLIHFPGDAQEMAVKVLHTGTQVLHVSNASTLPDGVNVSISHPVLALPGDHGETIVRIILRTSFNTLPGNHSFLIGFSNGTGHSMANVSVAFTLHEPALRVHIDSYHALKDRYTSASRGTPVAMDYHGFATSMATKNVQVSTSMERWTPNYNATVDTPFLDYPRVKLHDVLILPPVRVGFTMLELEAIKAFHQEGGHVIMLGSRYQQMSQVESNRLLDYLDAGIQFEQRNVENIIDNGWDIHFDELIINNINQTTVPGSGLHLLHWSTGSTLAITGEGIEIVARSAQGNTLVAFVPSNGTRGSIFVSGSETMLPVDEKHGDNMIIMNNMMSYYKEQVSTGLNVHLPTPRVFGDVGMNFSFQVINTTLPLPFNMSSVENLSCSIVQGDTWFMNVTTTVTGTWYTSGMVNLTGIPASSMPYAIRVQFTINGIQHHKRFGFHKFQDAGPSPVNLQVDHLAMLRGLQQGFSFNTTVDNATLRVHGTGTDPATVLAPVSFLQDMTATSTTSLLVGTSNPAGMYLATLELVSNDGTYPFQGSQRVAFEVLNEAPLINTSTSSFQDRSFDQIDLGDGLVAVQPVSTERPLSVKLFGSDTETPTPDMAAFVLFYPTYIIDNSVGLIPYGRNIFKTRLAFNPADGSFSGSIVIPRGVSFTVNDEQVSRSFASTGEYSGVLIVVIRDADGDYDYFAILLQISNPFSVDPWAIILIVIVGIAVVLGLVLFLSRNKQHARNHGYTQYGAMNDPAVVPDREYEFKYCPYCGEPVQRRARNCQVCGREILF